jgi:hypothetical protein
VEGNHINTNFFNVCEEYSAHITGQKAREEIRKLVEKVKLPTSKLRTLWEEPEGNLGPFEELPKGMQLALRDAALFYIQEHHLLTSSILFKVAYGSMFQFGASLIRYGWRLKSKPETSSESPKNISFPHIEIFFFSFRRFLGRGISWTGRTLAELSVKWAKMLLKYLMFSKWYKIPFVHALWQYLRVNPDNLIDHYINRIPTDSRISPIFKSGKSHVESCGLIGIDLLPAGDKLYFIEGNFNPALRAFRIEMYPDGDPLFKNILDYVLRNDYKRIIFFPSNISSFFDRETEMAWKKLAFQEGIHLEIIDDPLIGSPYPRHSSLFMDPRPPDGTLYVNGKYYAGSPVARLIGQKGKLEEQINLHNACLPEEQIIPVPKLILVLEDIPALDMDCRFPNLIVKNRFLDCTMGIILYKSDHIPHGANEWPNLVYEYVIPNRIKEPNGVQALEYVMIYRAHLLITPNGPIYLSSHKVTSCAPVPDHLGFGMVEKKAAYIANFSSGAVYGRINDIENKACERAVLSIGNVITRYIEKKHDLTPVT